MGETRLGIAQQVASGTPLSTCIGLGGATNSACQFVEDQGNFVNFSRSATGDLVSSGVTHNKRTPTYSETGANLTHYVHVSMDHENRKIGAEINVSNLLNQHAVVSVVELPATTAATIATATTNNPTGTDYNALMSGFNYVNVLNGTYGDSNKPNIYNPQYGLPNGFQTARQVRFKVAYTF